jgi:pentatricopeptide repeat protein
MKARGLAATTVTYTTLITAFARAGRCEDALATREAMRLDGKALFKPLLSFKDPIEIPCRMLRGL